MNLEELNNAWQDINQAVNEAVKALADKHGVHAADQIFLWKKSLSLLSLALQEAYNNPEDKNKGCDDCGDTDAINTNTAEPVER